MGRLHRTRVGNVELISLQDSWTTLPPTQMFDKTTAADWEPYKEFLDETGELTLNLGCWLIHSEGRTILVDTGLGGRETPMPLKERPALPALLHEAGVSTGEVDVLVFTHLHFDHIGWNTTDDGNGTPQPLFRNARHLIQRVEWEYWTGAAEQRRASRFAQVLAPLERHGLLDLVEGERAVTTEVVTVPTPGHTPGHVSFAIHSQGRRAYLLGDAAHQPVQLTETDWCPGADIDPETATKSRHAILDRIEKEGALIAAGHFPFPGLGRAVREGSKHRWRPLL